MLRKIETFLNFVNFKVLLEILDFFKDHMIHTDVLFLTELKEKLLAVKGRKETGTKS